MINTPHLCVFIGLVMLIEIYVIAFHATLKMDRTNSPKHRLIFRGLQDARFYKTVDRTSFLI